MSFSAVWPWAALALLGVYHGVNPGMGWLFAVGRGLQERRRSAVLGALLPIALGHELSIVLVVVAVVLTQTFVAPHTVRLIAAMALVAVVVYEKLGLGLLRRSWFNLDLAWSAVLLVAGAVTLFSA